MILALIFYAHIHLINGQEYISIKNDHNHLIYCNVTSDAGHFEFDVPALSESKKYRIKGKYKWSCD